MLANELLTIMVMNKIAVEKDAEIWPCERTEKTKRKARRLERTMIAPVIGHSRRMLSCIARTPLWSFGQLTTNG